MAESNTGNTNSDVQDIDDLLDTTLDKPTTIEKVLSVEEIKSMIAQLSVTEEGEDLKKAMADLKKAIKDNPAACASLLPEDIGEMVAALYKLTNRDLEQAIEKGAKSKRGSKSKVDLNSKEVQQEILDDL